MAVQRDQPLAMEYFHIFSHSVNRIIFVGQTRGDCGKTEMVLWVSFSFFSLLNEVKLLYLKNCTKGQTKVNVRSSWFCFHVTIMPTNYYES